MTMAFITGIVFVFALNFIVSYDVTVFVNTNHGDNSTPTEDYIDLGLFLLHLRVPLFFRKLNFKS